VAAVMDGVVMGGGVGVSLPASIRIATGNTTFAMPECGIGLFPDVGGGWYLSRLKGAAGTYLALTGARIKAADCLDLGLCTHYVEASDLPALKAALMAAPERAADVAEEFGADPGPPKLPEHAADRDRLFAGSSAHEILEALRQDDGEWARAQLDTLAAKSPMMLAVTRKLLGYGAKTTEFAHELEREYALAMHTIFRPDFMEGVRATVIDRDGKPRWEPATLDQITDDMVRDMFSSLGAQRWRPLTQ
jgi:enoyl-CoA hydratase